MSNKNTKVVTTTTDTAKRKLKDGKVTKANLAQSAKQLSKALPAPREVKYNYPDTANTSLLRKEFRRKARQSNRRFEKTLASLKKSNDAADQKELSKMEKEFKGFKSSTYTKHN